MKDKRLSVIGMMVVIAVSGAWAGTNSVRLSWEPNPEPDIGGYIVYWGTNANYQWSTNVGNTTTATVGGLQWGARYGFVVTAYNTSGLESEPSNIVYWRPPHGSELSVELQGSTNGVSWGRLTNLVVTNWMDLMLRTNLWIRLRMNVMNPAPQLILPSNQVLVMRTNIVLGGPKASGAALAPAPPPALAPIRPAERK